MIKISELIKQIRSMRKSVSFTLSKEWLECFWK